MKILYQWVENLAFYMVLITAVLRILPRKDYEKYVRVFMGMLLIIFIMLPLIKLTGMEKKFSDFYNDKQYEMEKEEIKKHEEYLKEIDFMDFIPEEYRENFEVEDETGTINVEEIRIGK